MIMANPNKKLKLNLSEIDQPIFQKSFIDDNSNAWLKEFKLSLSNASTRGQKIFLLTTIPIHDCSIRQAVKEFGVTRYMVVTARKLQTEKGFATHSDKKKGKQINENLLEKVKEFYLLEDISRVMPGVKDFKSITVDGVRRHEQVNYFNLFFDKFEFYNFLSCTR